MTKRNDAGVVARLRNDGRLVEALGFLLGQLVRADRTSHIRCLDPDAHQNGDAHPSMVVKPRVGRVTCAACGLDAGLLEIGVLRGLAGTASEVAQQLEDRFYAKGSGPGVTKSPSRVATSGTVEWPHYAKTAESLGWSVEGAHGGRRYLRMATQQLDGSPGRVKIRYEKSRDLQTAAFDPESSELPIGLITDNLFRDAVTGEPGSRFALLAGETCLLAWVFHARFEGREIAAASHANGEVSRLGELAEPFAGHHVIVLYDNDETGRREGPKRVAELLSAGAASAVSIHVPDPHKDVCDYLRSGGSVREIVQIADAAATQPPASGSNKEVVSPSPPAPDREWTPFPVALLPSPVAQFVAETATALGCDPALIALPCLAVLASAIGNARSIRLKSSWTEPSILWAASIGESGTLKSPAFDAAMEPLNRRQEEALLDYEAAVERHKTAKTEYGESLRRWKKTDCSSPPPAAPEQPHARRYFVQDTTVEALAPRLAESPNGLLLAREELSGWFTSFNLYRGGRGSDQAAFLQMYGARVLLVDRKTGTPPTIAVPRASLSITGTIQPAIMREVLGRGEFDSGLAARILLAYPPRRTKRWTDAVVRPSTIDAYDRTIRSLMELRAPEEAGATPPIAIGLSPEASQIWAEFYDEHAEWQARSVGDEAALLAKIEGIAARLALIVHCIRSVGDEAMTLGVMVDDESVRTGVQLARWFASEALRVYAVFRESPEEQQRRELVAWVRSRGGCVTARDLQRGPRQFRSDGVNAQRALENLARDGLGAWERRPPSERGGRGKTVFVLAESRAATATEPPASSLDDEVPSPGSGELPPKRRPGVDEEAA